MHTFSKFNKKSIFACSCTLLLSSFVLSSCSRGPTEIPQADTVDSRFTESKSSSSSLLRVQSLSVRDSVLPSVYHGISQVEVKNLTKDIFQSYLEIPVNLSSEGKFFLDVTITGYQDRDGSSAGSVSPAQVSLEMRVHSVTGEKIWEGKFASNEKDIISNILQKSDAKFASGRELLKRALAEGARSFSDARLKVFKR